MTHATNFKPPALSAYQQRKNATAVRVAVFERDDTCRVPWCEGDLYT